MSERHVLWIDSDVAVDMEKVKRLANLSHEKGVQPAVNAQVHLEQCRQMRQWCRQHDKRYSSGRMNSFLERLKIKVFEVRFGLEEAEHWGEILDEHFPGPDDWRNAKLRCVKARLPETIELTTERVPMTTDWLTSLMIWQNQHFVVAEDRGPEWAWLRKATPKRAMSFEEAMAWLEGLSAPSSPG